MTDTTTTENSDAAPEEPETEATPVDEKRQPLLDVLQTELGEALLDAVIAKADITVRVDPSVWRRAAEICHDRLGMDYFCFLSGIDWKIVDLSGEKVFEPAGAPVEDDESATATPDASKDTYVTGVAGGDSRFQVFARYYSVTDHVGITLKADLDESDPRVDSVQEVYRGADWHERETWEMYGFQFDGHPGLRHMYLPTEFEGNPLRKDFPLLSREVKPWPGLVDVEPIPGDDTPGEGETPTEEGGE